MRILPVSFNNISFQGRKDKYKFYDYVDTYEKSLSDVEQIKRMLNVAADTREQRRTANNIREVIDTVDDEYVLDVCKNILYDITDIYKPKKSESEVQADLDKIENMVNVVNEQNDVYNYYTKQGPPYETDGILNRFITKVRDIKRKDNINGVAAKQKLCKELDANKTQFAKDFNNEIKRTYLLSFLYDNNKSDADMCMYFYKKHYLDTLPLKTRTECFDIADKYNTYVFLSDPDDVENAVYINKELGEWDRASKGEATLPSFIYVTKTMSIDDDSKAYTLHNKDFVIISDKKDVKYSLRHEIAHINDRENTDGLLYGDTIQERLGEYKRNVLNGINLNNKFGIDSNNSWYRDEFINGGISEVHIDYAYTDKEEFIAVASEGNYEAYSDEFKSVLVKLGLPSYVFNMTPICEL